MVLVAVFAGLENATLKLRIVNTCMCSSALSNVCRFAMSRLTAGAEVLVHITHLDGFLKASTVDVEPVLATVA
jgi:hypothetical protein